MTGRSVLSGLLATTITAALVIVTEAVLHSRPALPATISVADSGDAQTVQRPGYEHVAVGIADAAPLRETPSDLPMLLAGTPVIQACNLLSLADLEAQKIPEYADPSADSANYQRSSLVTDSDGRLKIGAPGFAHAGSFAVNRCGFTFARPDGGAGNTMSVAVSQPAYATGDIYKVGKEYQHRPNIGPVSWGARRRPSEPGELNGDSVLRLGRTVVNVEYHLTSAEYIGKLPAVIQVIGRRLAEQTAKPTGPSSLGYDSPAFPKRVAQPCPLLAAGAVTEAIGAPASPLVVETPATAVGTTTFEGAQRYNYVRSSCARGTGEDDPGHRKSVKLETTSYVSEVAAEKQMDVVRTRHHGRELDTPLGDGAVVQADPVDAATNGILIFRKGRFIFQLQLLDPHSYPAGIGEKQAVVKLVPIGQKILRTFGDQN